MPVIQGARTSLLLIMGQGQDNYHKKSLLDLTRSHWLCLSVLLKEVISRPAPCI